MYERTSLRASSSTEALQRALRGTPPQPASDVSVASLHNACESPRSNSQHRQSV